MKAFFKDYGKEVTIFLVFLLTSFVIVSLHLLFHPIRVLGMDTSIFYMDEKHTLAAFFTVVTSFLVGYLALTGISKKTKGLARIVDIVYGSFFLVLAADEYFEIHEYANTVVKGLLTEEGLFNNLANTSWIFPLSIVVFAVFLLLGIKIIRTKNAARLPLVIGSFCFFAVLVFELFGSVTYGQHIYLYFVAVEEGLEMVGVTFFLLATLIGKKSNVLDLKK